MKKIAALTAGFAAACAIHLGVARPAAGAPARPNVILIVIDDMGWANSAVYGSPLCETPAIDKLAKDGAR